MMFGEEKLFPIHKGGPLGIWGYKASDLADANAARHQLGYFPKGALRPGDVVYIHFNDTTSHQYVTTNSHEGGQIALCLFG